MIRYLHLVSRTAALALAVASSVAMGQTESTTAPPVPADIQVPPRNVAFLKGYAIGTQNYICLPSSTGVAWTLFGPQATLFFTLKVFNREVLQQIATHFLSPNPDEDGTLRPTWQSSLDTSAVWGQAIGSSSDPAYVAPGAIPWLLLKVVGAERGPSEGNSLKPATYIQRVNTTGGPAPSSGCGQPSDVGAREFVPYTADYIFYKKADR
jgi:hypothetical protein